MWCAVINTVLADHRAALSAAGVRARLAPAATHQPTHEQVLAPTDCAGPLPLRSSGPRAGTDLHLPPWVSASEKSVIGACVRQWVDALSPGVRDAIIAAGSALPAGKPLRPVWLSPASFPAAPGLPQLAAVARAVSLGRKPGSHDRVLGTAGELAAHCKRAQHSCGARHGDGGGVSWEETPPLLDGTQPYVS